VLVERKVAEEIVFVGAAGANVPIDTFVQWIRPPHLWLNPGVHMNAESSKRNRRLRHRRFLHQLPRARRPASFRYLAGLSLAALLMATGCSHAPEYSIFGSFFPVWIFCAAGGLLMTAGVRVLIARTAIAEHLRAPVLLYLSMAIFFTCMLWMMFYS
jgi:hypothetical protein